MKPFDVYPLLDLEPVKGEGNYIFCSDGQRYLDFYGGHAAISIGHSHPHYIQKISRQLEKIGFYSNSVRNPLQEELASRLGHISGYEKYQLFLCNSGAEANENALKMASFHTGRSRVIAFRKAFHGRTTTALSVTDNNRYTAPINDTGDVCFLEMNDLKGLRNELEKGDVCAVILEPVRGVGGIRVFQDAFLQEASRLCSSQGTVLIADEIQSGAGRTGRFFAHQHAGIRPDIITIAKGTGNGFPIGGTLLSPAFEAINGRLGSTFGGNHLACSAALAVLDVIEEDHLIRNAAAMGKRLMKKLSTLPNVQSVQGRGLMIGIEFPFAAKKIRMKLINDKRILTGASANPRELRLLPPLTISNEEVDRFISDLHNILTQHTPQ